MKTLSVGWSLLSGLAAVVWQVVSYYLRFGGVNPNAAWTDYLAFFIGGALGGLLLVFFFNRQPAQKGRWSVLVAFVLAFPVAMIFMLGGGLLGWVGMLLFPLLPWLLFMWIGSLVGKFALRA